ncbi:expressed protein [Arabidopsis lyrata subsp. lyrata]|uniref:Expressed protein n=1 Tax=Arabidopsis lyrata subsp. lyrata TaxID=81972 RepID=D7M563_ARALL|nr:expressed protein [Arabidopsis lyrata subsp. lyrata]
MGPNRVSTFIAFWCLQFVRYSTRVFPWVSMGDVIAELVLEANELLDTTTDNWNALLEYSQNALLPQHLQAVRTRPVPAEVAAVDPAAANQQEASNSTSGGPQSSGSGSEA